MFWGSYDIVFFADVRKIVCGVGTKVSADTYSVAESYGFSGYTTALGTA